MIDKVPDVKPPEIDPNGDARKRVLRIAVPIGKLNCVQKLALDGRVRCAAVNLKIVLARHQKMSLVQVEFVILKRPVLNRPILNRSLRRDDGRGIGRAEEGRLGTV